MLQLHVNKDSCVFSDALLPYTYVCQKNFCCVHAYWQKGIMCILRKTIFWDLDFSFRVKSCFELRPSSASTVLCSEILS